MWLKAPDLECSHNFPLLPGLQAPNYMQKYLNAIWRCDDCLSVFIVKWSEEKTHIGEHILVWKPYRIGD